MSTMTMNQHHLKESRTSKTVDWGMIGIGALLILTAIILMFFPGITLVTLTVIAGIALIIAGIVDIIAYSRMRGTQFSSGWTLASGIINLIVGAIFLFQPIAMAVVIPWISGIVVITYGVYYTIMGFMLRNFGNGWGWAVASGILTIICGIFLFAMPELFIFFLAFFLMFRGATMAVFGLMAPKEIQYL